MAAKPAPAAAHPAKVVTALGLFVGSQSPAEVLALGQQLGVTPSVDTVYADQSSGYCSYSPPTTSMTLMVGIGNCTAAQVTAIAQNLVRAGQTHAIIRVMWEQNQDLSGWFQTWNQLSLSAAQYVSVFQNTVATMRAVNPRVQLHVEPQRRNQQRSTGADMDRHVARQGVRQSGRRRPVRLLGIHRECPSGCRLCDAQGLPVAIPEWGLNGSDDPTFINAMASLINNAANDIAVQAYFSYAGSTDSDITQFNASEAAYKADFG